MVKKTRVIKKALVYLSMVLVLGGCAIAAKQAQLKWSDKYGESSPHNRQVQRTPLDAVDYWTEVKPVFEKRCVSCHACYDAACQLKTTSIEGIERGLSKERVYDSSRLAAATPTRLYEDASTLEDWRQKGFSPVLNEHEDLPSFNREASLLYRSLVLKEADSFPTSGTLPSDDYTFGLGRSQECPTPAEFEEFSLKRPHWGMPYGLPGLSPKEQTLIKEWVEAGATYTAREPLSIGYRQKIEEWETFFNQKSKKSKLVSRYLYEHLFLTHLYFPDLSDRTFFKLVRSETPPGIDVKLISTRRPFDAPGVETVFYRIVPQLETIVDKNHNPYRLDLARRLRWESLFFTNEYSVTQLPGYSLPKGANPFVTFEQLPMSSRYKFLLDDAQSSIMNFIKGSVCRGQVAVNVVRDQFWVFFLDPDSFVSQTVSTLLPNATEELALANSSGGNSFMPLSHWLEYVRLEEKRRRGRDEFMFQYFSQHPLDLELVWDGDGINPNAALTVFRHLDSATVEQGLVGDTPKTVWFIDYTLLERIHYLLVAGYDVYGTLGHQLISRLHMDFLRMEGETNFINFLPKAIRDEVRSDWYQGASKRVTDYLRNPKFDEFIETGINFSSNDPRRELIEKMRGRVAAVVPTKRELDNVYVQSVRDALKRLATMKGVETQYLAEVTVLRITGEKNEHVSILKNNGHKNMTSLFNESKRLSPDENTLTVVYGFLGSYPNAFMDVPSSEINRFVDQVMAMRSESDYSAIMDEFGVRRTNPNFWKFSDEIYSALEEIDSLNAGYFDYNRLENR